MSTEDALRRFADRLADPSSDEVIAALMLNARERGPRLADVLDRVSEGMAELVTMRREIVQPARTDARLSGKILSALTLGGLLLLLVNKTYMAPYHTVHRSDRAARMRDRVRRCCCCGCASSTRRAGSRGCSDMPTKTGGAS